MTDVAHEIELHLAARPDDREALRAAMLLACFDVASHGPYDLAIRREWIERGASFLTTEREEIGLRFLEARLLGEADRLDEAADVLAALLDRYPGSKWMLYVEIYFAGILRMRGDYGEADRRLARLEHAYGDADDARLVEWGLLPLRIQIDLDLGLPDRAAPAIRREHAAVEAMRAASSDARTLELVAASQIRRANLLYAQGFYADVVAEVDRCLSDDEVYSAAPGRRAHLQLMKGMALTDLARTNPGWIDEAKAALDVPDEAVLSAPDRLRLALCRADLLLLCGEATAARDVLEGATGAAGFAGARVEPRDAADVARMKARIAVALLPDGDSPREELRDLAAAFDELLERWCDVPLRAGGVGFLRKSSRRAVLSELLRLRLAVAGSEGGAERALDDLLRAHTCATDVRRLGLAQPSLAEIRDELLDDGRGMLLYLTAPDQSHVFAVDRRQVVHALLPPEDELEALVREYVAVVGTPPFSVADEALRRRDAARERALAQRLGVLLLPAPIRERVNDWSGVTVCPLDWLELLPFECVAWDEEERLATRRPIDSLASPAIGLWARRRLAADGRTTPVRDRGFLLVTDATPGAEGAPFAELPRLDLGDDELARLTAAYPPEQVTILARGRATRAALRAIEPSRFRVAQFLVHGVHEAGVERTAALLLTPHGDDDGLLRAEDVEALDAPPLVVLTSCSIGRAPLRVGDAGAAGLASIWLRRGAQAVLHARTAIDLHATLALSRTLHERLAAGSSPAEALCEARRAVRSNPRHEAPFYWGLVSVEGLGHERLPR